MPYYSGLILILYINLTIQYYMKDQYKFHLE